MHNSHDWNACVDHLYDSVGLEDRLTTALSRFRPFFDSSAVVFATTPDPRTQQSALLTGAVGLPTAAWVEYVSHFNVYDEWVKAGLARNMEFPDGVVRGSALVPEEQLRESYFWREWLAKYRVGDIISCVIEPPAQDSASSFVTFQRGDAQPRFSDADLVKLAALGPHLRRALRLHRRLAPQLAIGATLMQLFQAAEAPMLLIGRDGKLLEHNVAAKAAMDGVEPLLASRSARLYYRQAGGWHDLEGKLAVFETQAVPAFEIAVQNDVGDEALLEVRQVHAAFTGRLATHETAAVCTLRRKRSDGGAVVARRCGLTVTEWKIAVHLANGLTAAQAAAATGVKLTTVRTHIRSALTKTGTQRQAQLIAKLFGAPSVAVNPGHSARLAAERPTSKSRRPT
jgi:DNA-binding CsgD family transcriptional regulator